MQIVLFQYNRQVKFRLVISRSFDKDLASNILTNCQSGDFLALHATFRKLVEFGSIEPFLYPPLINKLK